jgi:hypothetical protein
MKNQRVVRNGQTTGLFLVRLSVCLLLSGCSMPASSPALSPVTALRVDSRQIEIGAAASVQSLPLYHQAQQACKQSKYQEAASLLARLASEPCLTADQRAFCQAQRQICLRHLSAPASASAVQHSLASTLDTRHPALRFFRRLRPPRSAARLPIAACSHPSRRHVRKWNGPGGVAICRSLGRFKSGGSARQPGSPAGHTDPCHLSLAVS